MDQFDRAPTAEETCVALEYLRAAGVGGLAGADLPRGVYAEDAVGCCAIVLRAEVERLREELRKAACGLEAAGVFIDVAWDGPGRLDSLMARNTYDLQRSTVAECLADARAALGPDDEEGSR